VEQESGAGARPEHLFQSGGRDAISRPDGLIIGIDDSFYLRFVCGSAERVFGRTEDEVVGKHLMALIAERQREIFSECLRRIPSRGAGAGEYAVTLDLECLRDDGTTVAREATFWQIPDTGVDNSLYVGFIFETPSRPSPHKALEHSEEELRQIVDYVPGVFWLCDIPFTHFSYVSQAYERLWGRSCQSLKDNPLSWLDAIHPEDRPAIEAHIAQRRPDDPYQCEYRVVRPDGRYSWILDRGFPLRDSEQRIYRLAGVAVDISERKAAEFQLRRAQDGLEDRVAARTAQLSQAVVLLEKEVEDHRAAEEALRETRDIYQSVMSALEEGIVFQDEAGSILATNPAAEKILGLSARELRDRPSFDPRWQVIREDGETLPGPQHPAMVTLVTGKPCNSVVMGVYREDQKLVWISVNSRPLFRNGETTPYAVVTSFYGHNAETCNRGTTASSRGGIGPILASAGHG
jgi:PAS domain S-box-containing protein